MKEQSSILTPNNKLVGVKSTKEEPKLPKPTGWRLLVLPFKMKEKTKGGIVLAEATLERQQVASQCGLVLISMTVPFPFCSLSSSRLEISCSVAS